MALKYKDHRVGVFFDIQNLYHSAKHLYSARVNFKEVLKTAIAGRKLMRAIAYVVKSETAEGEESFFDALEKSGIELRTKDLQIFPGGAKKADWDVGLSVDAIRYSSSVDVVVIISGDGDYVPLVDYLKAMGKQVEVIAFDRTSSAKLKEATDEFIDLGQEADKYLMKSNQSTKSNNRSRKTK